MAVVVRVKKMTWLARTMNQTPRGNDGLLRTIRPQI